jgi:hypothetical protein
MGMTIFERKPVAAYNSISKGQSQDQITRVKWLAGKKRISINLAIETKMFDRNPLAI